jgi:soluble lytic murein transglycosylase-like protein
MPRYVISVLVILLTIAASASLFFPDYWIHRYDDVITRQARVYHIDEKLVWSLIYQETYFRAWKIGAAEEIGLMQVTPLVAREWAKETGLKE